MTNAYLCHMKIILGDGSVAEDTKTHEKPVKLTLGDNSLSPAFEKKMSNVTAGDERSFTLAAADAFGEIDQEQIHHVERSRFGSEMQPEQGMIVNFTSQNGQETLGIVRDVVGESVTVDFNHPLAGQDITFEIEVIKALQ